MINGTKPAKELNTWKEISSYLGVAVRTAQEYEIQLGLPIHRLAGRGKPRVRALSSELDEWKKRQSLGPTASEHTLLNDQETQDHSGRVILGADVRRWLYLGFAIIGTLALIAYWAIWRKDTLADYLVQGRNLIALDSKGRELWRHSFPGPLVETGYLDIGHAAHGWIGDLDGNGKRQLIILADPWDRASVGTSAICFEADGKQRWQFIPGRTVVAGSGDRMTPPFLTNGIQVIRGHSPADTRIAISSNHYLEHANQVAILNGAGQVIGEYWHPGHLLRSDQGDLDGDGRKELLLVGVHNGNHQATMVVLDPVTITGVVTPALMQDRRFELLNMATAAERAVVLFPRSCISSGQPYTRASVLHVTKDRIVAVTAEGVREQDGGFVYEFDFNLQVINVVPNGFGVQQKHQELEAQGRLDHAFDVEAECARLKAGVLIRRGT